MKGEVRSPVVAEVHRPIQLARALTVTPWKDRGKVRRPTVAANNQVKITEMA
jgi:hypothetical protein